MIPPPLSWCPLFRLGLAFAALGAILMLTRSMLTASVNFLLPIRGGAEL